MLGERRRAVFTQLHLDVSMCHLDVWEEHFSSARGDREVPQPEASEAEH